MKRAIGDHMCLGNKNVADLEIALMQFFLTAALNKLVEQMWIKGISEVCHTEINAQLQAKLKQKTVEHGLSKPLKRRLFCLGRNERLDNAALTVGLSVRQKP